MGELGKIGGGGTNRARALVWLAAAALLAAHGALALRTAAWTGPTYDEPAHLADGYVALRTGDHSLNPEHPPLAKKWAALPLLRMPLPPLDAAPMEQGPWIVAKYLFYPETEAVDGAPLADAVFRAARARMLVFSLGLGAAVFLWSRMLWGAAGALFSLALFAFSPNFIGHACLVHTDIAASLGFVALAAVLWRFRRGIGWSGAAGAGAALGFAMAAKFSGVLAAPLAAAALAWIPSRRRSEAAEKPKFELERRAGRIALALAAAALIAAASYGWPPQPMRYVEGFHSVYRRINPVFEPYFWGRFSPDGFWLYFPGAMLLKTPLPELLAWAAALALAARIRPRARWAAPLSLAAYFLLAAVFKAYNIGVRYVFPSYVFLYVFAGLLAAPGAPALRARRAAALALALWLAVVGTRSVPDGIAYFNPLAAGGGPRYLDDSNLDWGQASREVARYLIERGDPDIVVGWQAFIAPSDYGARYTPLAGSPERVFVPTPGEYLISGNLLTGREMSPATKGLTFDWLGRYRPFRVFAGSIYGYRFEYAERGREGFDEATGANRLVEEDLLREGVERMRGLAETTGAGVYRQLASVFGARLAARLVGQGRCEDALAVCDEALRDWPAQAGAMAARADALLELGRFDEARAEIERLKGAAPGYGAIEDLEAKWAARQR